MNNSNKLSNVINEIARSPKNNLHKHNLSEIPKNSFDPSQSAKVIFDHKHNSEMRRKRL